MIRKFAIFLLIVVMASACGTRTAQVSSQVTNWTFPASTGKTITLANDAGDIRIRQTTGSDILLTATKSARSVADLDGVEIDVKQASDGISSTLNYLPGSWSVSVAYDIQVPPNRSVQINSSSGNITVENYQGALHLSTASGTIVMHNVNGEIRATTSSGNIEAHDVDGNVNVSSADGSIVVSYSAAPELMDDPVLFNRRSGNVDLSRGIRWHTQQFLPAVTW